MSKRLRYLRSDLVSRVALISFTAGALAGCSSAVERFGGEPVYTGSTQNQREILAGSPRQPSYDDIINGSGGTSAGLPPRSSAPVTTGSITPRTKQVARSQPVKSYPVQQPAPKAVSSSRLPAMVETAPAPEAVASAAPERSWRGWTSAGGTRVTVRNGDTVDSMSRRFGVPVQAILAVNNVQDSSQVRPGQSVIIPTYVYNDGNGSSSVTASAARPAPARAVAAEKPLVTGSINPTSMNGSALPEPKPRHQPSFAEVQQSMGGAPRMTDAQPIRVSVTPESKPRRVASAAPTQRQVAPSVSGQVPTPRRSPDGTVTATRDISTEKPVVARTEKPKKVEEQQIASISPTNPTGGAVDTTKDDNAISDIGFRWPVRGRIISEYGTKPGGTRNDGVNLAVPEGTPVKAAGDGTVIYSGNELKGYGNLVLLRHENGWVSAYAHNSKLNVKRGDTVRRGDVIALAGDSGSVSQPQVHFELRKGNKPVDPLQYLPRG